MLIPADPTAFMTDEEYWLDLLSTAEQVLAQSGESEAASIISHSIKEPNMVDAEEALDSLCFTWEIALRLQPTEYAQLLDDKSGLESKILNCLNLLHHDERNALCEVRIEPIIKRYLHWDKAVPRTREKVVGLIRQENQDLLAVATGTSYKLQGLEDRYRERHREIIAIAQQVGFDYPVTDSSLAAWWQHIKQHETYAERRAYISELFEPLYSLLNENEDDSINVAGHMASDKAVLTALNDAQAHIDAGQFPNAVDRVHTAFHGYLREVLDEHGITYVQSDALPALLAKLYEFYSQAIQPPEVAKRIKKTLRSSSGIVQSLNEIRNNNTIAHPTHQLIEKREAEFVIRIVNALLSYIEDIELQVNSSAKP